MITSVPAAAQYKLLENESSIKIEGTSTRHDWTAEAEEMEGAVKAMTENNKIYNIEWASIVVPVNSLKSGKKLMDVNMYKALKSEEHPHIKYKFKELVYHNGEIIVKGDLTIGGVTNEIKTKGDNKQAGKYLKIKGDFKLKMSDYDIKPPEFMYGAFKTGDEVTIIFELIFSNEDKI